MDAQLDLFAGDGDQPVVKPLGTQRRRLRVVVTVKAAPQPSGSYGETVCVAGLSIDPILPGWVRLYPINFRYLDSGQFAKYDVVTLDAVPAPTDPRAESWRPRIDSLQKEGHLAAWGPRRRWIDPYIETSMCALRSAVTDGGPARSLGLVRVREVTDLVIRPHPGWTPEEQAKIDQYVNQLDLLSSTDRTPLQAPRMKGWYRWRCGEPGCRGHEQGLLDWEFVALQRRLRHLDDAALAQALRSKFLDEVCAPTREVSFYVGNQAKRPQTFSVLGIFWPPVSRP